MDEHQFEKDLEFVSSLASVEYLECLHAVFVFASFARGVGLNGQGYFAQEEFLNYLRYLMYWTEPEYARFIMFAGFFPLCCFLTLGDLCRYPMALSVLRCLQEEEFRSMLTLPAFLRELNSQMMIQWQFKNKV